MIFKATIAVELNPDQIWVEPSELTPKMVEQWLTELLDLHKVEFKDSRLVR